MGFEPLSKGPGFKGLLETRPVKRGAWANLHFKETGLGPVFVGYIIPKRLVKRSVDRNLIRRWLGEMLRQMQSEYQGGAYLLRVTQKLPSIGFEARKTTYLELRALLNLEELLR